MGLQIPHLPTRHGKIHLPNPAQILPSNVTQTTAIIPPASRNNIWVKHPKATRGRHLPPLDDAGIKCIQVIVSTVIHHARAVDNKVLTALSSIGSEQASATQATNKAANHLLDYLATYPNDGITYRSSNIILAAHSDSAYLNETYSHSGAGSHILCSNNDPIPRDNDPILSLSQIINVVMSSANEAELDGLFITAKAMVPLRHTIKEMKWQQPWSPIQTDNSTANGFANQTISPMNTNSMDMRFYWLRCQDSQGQFRYYWDPGTTNREDYHTKRHLIQYHEAHRQWAS